jgi:hypothetical protein
MFIFHPAGISAALGWLLAEGGLSHRSDADHTAQSSLAP